ncbi:hypothetical protein QQF64_035896 [Cirrhinus molitorella]|uniref:Myb/SANT-like DNA-binding domain-containing protein n=1 Tax=Cirrhinus molitorella TaxID=172907 RepID=A0ABR3NH24_9TELE
MKEKGFDKPWQILRSKWKALKQKYLSEKRQLCKSGAGGRGKVKFKYFDQMDEILGQRPIVTSMNTVLHSIDDADEDSEMAGCSNDLSSDSLELTASCDDGSMTPHDEAPDTPNVLEERERESSTLSSQESWRQPRRRRSSHQMDIFKEQARQDQAILSTMTEVLNRAGCFERATEAAERHAYALEALAGAQHTFACQQPPYLLQHPPTYQQQQPPYLSQTKQPPYYHHPQQPPPSSQPQSRWYHPQHQSPTTSPGHSPSYQNL